MNLTHHYSLLILQKLLNLQNAMLRAIATRYCYMPFSCYCFILLLHALLRATCYLLKC
jgi:hypothetical protein